jgi:cell division transport system permease protein
MFLVSIYRILKTAIISLWRNRWLSLAAILVMVLTLFTISFFGSLVMVINKTSETLRDRVDIAVYFNDTASKDQIFSVQSQLTARPDVKSIKFVSKEDALVRWQEQNKDSAAKDILSDTYNPLPPSLEIKGDRPEDLETIYTLLKSEQYQPLIYEISYLKNKKVIDRLISMTNLVEKLGWSLSALFVLISVLIIYNTIRLTIFARSTEIEIMKLVGASDWYVQGPFFIEGAVYGLLSGVSASGILYLAYRFAFPAVTRYLSESDATMLFSGVQFWLVSLTLIGVGLILGTACSIFAVKKHLK